MSASLVQEKERRRREAKTMWRRRKDNWGREGRRMGLRGKAWDRGRHKTEVECRKQGKESNAQKKGK
jgi:hypothetical protein